MTEYIGIDIGGHNIRVGAIDENEELIFQYKEKTFENVRTREDLYDKIRKMIQKVPKWQKVKGIGIGVTGVVDKKLGRIIISNNVGLLNNFPLVEELKKDFNKSIFLENDAQVATLAESIKGKGIGRKKVCYITISTGLGVGVVVDKKIYDKYNDSRAILAEILLNDENTNSYYISGTVLLKQAQNKISKDIESTVELFELEKNNNQIAKEIIQKFKEHLVELLLNVTKIINPDIVILGGGVLKSKDRFLHEVIDNFNKKVFPLKKDIIIDTTKFEEPGIIGAALLAKNELKKYKRRKNLEG